MKYLITPDMGLKGDGSDVRAHVRHCKQNQIPSIVALTRRTRCLLICECDCIDGVRLRSLEAHASEIQDFFKTLGDRYPKPARIDPGFPAWYFFFDLLISDAPQVAEETYDFLTEVMNRAVGE